jgi:predicted enzyme related to lactoylglutathione lyase
MDVANTFPPLTPELNVRDIGASLDFYTRLLGLKFALNAKKKVLQQ